MSRFQTEDNQRTSLSTEQIQQYHSTGFLILQGACSNDLLDAFNAHIQAIRSAEEIPAWASPRKGNVPLDAKERSQ